MKTNKHGLPVLNGRTANQILAERLNAIENAFNGENGVFNYPCNHAERLQLMKDYESAIRDAEQLYEAGLFNILIVEPIREQQQSRVSTLLRLG